jgi:hypothetical protein
MTMIRTIAIAGVSALATAAFFISGLGSQVAGTAVAAAAGQVFPHGAFAAQLPPEIRDLSKLDPAARFGHFSGVQARFTDVNNVSHTVTVVPGTAQSVSADSLTIAPNDASLGPTKTYQLGNDTIVRKAPQSWSGGQPSAQIATGDKVVVVSMDGDQPRAVIVAGPDGFGRGHRWGPGWGSRDD